MKRFVCLSALFFSVLSSPLPASEFSNIDGDLEKLENLISDTLRDTEEQRKQLDDLQRNLSESGNLIADYESVITEREKSLRDLQNRLNEMSEIYRRRSALSERYAKNSRFWRTFTLIAVPAAAGLGIWAGIEIGRR